MITPASALLLALCAAPLYAFREQLGPTDLLLPLAAALPVLSSWKSVVKRMAALNLFLLFVAGFAWLGGLGPEEAFLMVGRGNLAAGTAVLLFTGKSPLDLYRGAAALKFPQTLTTLLFFLAKYGEIFPAQLARQREALRLRGFAPGNDQLTYKTIGYSLGALLLQSFRRAETLSDALKIRGFGGRLHLFPHPRPTPFDLFGFLALIGTFLGSIL